MLNIWKFILKLFRFENEEKQITNTDVKEYENNTSEEIEEDMNSYSYSYSYAYSDCDDAYEKFQHEIED